MLPTNRATAHPGVLLREVLDEIGISQVAFARHLGISLQRLNEIVNGRRGVTGETALLLGQALGQSPEYWMNLQMAYEITRARPHARRVPRVKPVRNAA